MLVHNDQIDNCMIGIVGIYTMYLQILQFEDYEIERQNLEQ